VIFIDLFNSSLSQDHHPQILNKTQLVQLINDSKESKLEPLKSQTTKENTQNILVK